MTSQEALANRRNQNLAKANDPIKFPSHYTSGGIEFIDYAREKLTPEEFQGFCMGNVIKYITRHKKKNGVEDLRKAQVYLGWLIESEEKNDA